MSHVNFEQPTSRKAAHASGAAVSRSTGRLACSTQRSSRRPEMLAADKDRLVAGLKQHALHLRQKELEYYVERYSNITTQASILAGFAFDSLVELEIPEKWMTQRSGICTVYYIAASCTMAFALYTVCVSSFATVYGHRLALQVAQ